MTDAFSKKLKKQSARAKVKLLESLGKADRTTDEYFEENFKNFNKQHKAAERLQKDFKMYQACIKALSTASKAMHDTIRDIYEPEWPAREHVLAISQSCDLLLDDYQTKLADRVINPLDEYCSNFVEMKTKTAKRGRKLIDFDSARNNLSTVLASSKKGQDDPKVQKAQLELDHMGKLYRDINEELSDELPAFYDSRITFFVNDLQSLFNTENNYHNDAAKINRELCCQLDVLGNALESLRVTRSIVDYSNSTLGSIPNKGNDSLMSNKSEEKRTQLRTDEVNDNVEGKNPFDSDGTEQDVEAKVVVQKPVARARMVDKQKPEELSTPTIAYSVLYKLRSTHRYMAEDTDELWFEAGEIISVLEPQNPDDLDEGWLLGTRDSDGLMGVFPANFTKPI